MLIKIYTTYKESVFGVILVRIYPGFSRIRTEYSADKKANSIIWNKIFFSELDDATIRWCYWVFDTFFEATDSVSW